MRIALGLVGLCSLAAAASAQPMYDVINVGDLKNGIGTSVPRGINNAGFVIGVAPNSSGIERAFRWDPSTGVMSLLNALPGQTSQYAVSVNPLAIRNDGVIVGDAPIYSGTSFTAYHAARWPTPSDVLNLGNSGSNRSTANSINVFGDIVGYQNIPPGFSRPKVWLANGNVIDIPLNAGETVGIAQRIADDGSVVVYVNQSADPYLKAFIRKPDGFRLNIPFIAGTNQFSPSDMNNQVQVVGYVRQGSLTKGVIWDEQGGPRFLPLGTMTESAGLGINEAGAIVGWVKGPGFPAQTAAVWYTPESMPVILSQRLTPTSASWGLFGGEGVNDINDSGWILLTGLTPPQPGRYQHAIVLAPANSCPLFSDHPDNVRFTYCSKQLFLGAAASSKQAISYSWTRNGVPVTDGSYGATKVIGATTNALRIDNPTPAWAGEWICLATNPCGTFPSNPAQVTICRADLSCDGIVDDADFSKFVVAYDILDCFDPTMPSGCVADINDDFIVDDADFSIFVLAYDALLCP